MKHATWISLMACCASTWATAAPRKLSTDLEVLEFQKLEITVQEQMTVGIASREHVLKAEILT
jgi:hypothetical protein